MRELGAASAITHRPYAIGSGLKSFVDANVAPRIEFDARCVESNPTSIRLTAGRHQDVAGIDGARTSRSAHVHADPFAGAALHAHDLCVENYFDAFVLEQLLQRLADVVVLARGKLRPLFHDGNASAEPAHGLRELEPDIATAKHEQMFGNMI